MATPNRYAIREAGEATFFDLVTKQPIVTLRTLKTSGVETSGETVYARGGKGNAKLVGFSSNREARINFEDAIFDNAALAMLTGNDPVVGKHTIYLNEKLTVASGKVTLSKTPKEVISLMKLLPDGTNGEVVGHTAEGKVLTPTGVQDGDMLIAYYTAETDETATKIRVSSDAFGKSFMVVLDVFVRDEHTLKDFAAQLIIPKGKFEDNFNLNFAAEGDPAVLTLPIEILKDTNSADMWYMVIFDDELIE